MVGYNHTSLHIYISKIDFKELKKTKRFSGFQRTGKIVQNSALPKR